MGLSPQDLINRMPSALLELALPIDRVDVPQQGATSDVAILSGPRGRFVVKHAAKPPYHEWLRREHWVLSRLASSGIPTPKPVHYVEASGGRSNWLLMEHLPGIPLRAALHSAATSAQRRSLLFEFGRAVAAIHRQPVPEELASEGPWLERMLRLAELYLQNYEVDGDAELLQRLSAERPGPAAPCLIHGDCTLDNVLVAGGKVSGVIDWCWGAWGDPRYDLALATRQEPEAFQDPSDFDAFYEGYAGQRLTGEERTYFMGIYEFF